MLYLTFLDTLLLLILLLLLEPTKITYSSSR